MNHFEHDGPDDLQTLRAKFIQSVFVFVPGRIVEVDDVEGGDAEVEKRYVVVVLRDAFVDEVSLVAELGGGAPDQFV